MGCRDQWQEDQPGERERPLESGHVLGWSDGEREGQGSQQARPSAATISHLLWPSVPCCLLLASLGPVSSAE